MHSEVIRVFFFERIKEQIDGVLEIVVVLAHFHRVNHRHQRVEVLLMRRRFVEDIAHQRAVQQHFGVAPERIAAFLSAVGVGNQDVCQLQNILFRVDVMERVIVKRLLEIDGVEETNLVLFLFQQVSALNEQAAFRVIRVKIENRSVAYNFRLRNYLLSHHHASAASSCPPRCPCSLC